MTSTCFILRTLEKKLDSAITQFKYEYKLSTKPIFNIQKQLCFVYLTGTTMIPTSFPLGTFLNPAASCKNIPTSSPSGNYWIQSTSTGYATMEYCHMSPPCSCSRPPGWMRVADLNMTDPQEHCPSGFRTIISPKRMCSELCGPGCASVTFLVNGVHQCVAESLGTNMHPWMHLILIICTRAILLMMHMLMASVSPTDALLISIYGHLLML